MGWICGSLFGYSRLHNERRVLSIRPLTHRAVVVARPLIAEQPQNEYAVRRTDAALSIGYDFLVRRRADLFKHCPKFVRGFDCLMAVIRYKVQPFQVDRAGNTP